MVIHRYLFLFLLVGGGHRNDRCCLSFVHSPYLESLHKAQQKQEEPSPSVIPFFPSSPPCFSSHKTVSSRDSNFVLSPPSTLMTFDDIGGYHEIKEELLQLLDFFNRTEWYRSYGVRVPRGLLLEGPPGNGKTLLVKALHGMTTYSMIVASGSSFNEKFVGIGASRIRELFEFARDHTPCILFVDEIDALARRRSDSSEGSGDERGQTLNELLVQMDGFCGSSNILFIGATNRKDMLDEAILRPGRIDKIIHVPNPSRETRKEIITIHRRQKPIEISTDTLADITEGMSGAQIENILNEATLLSLRNNILPVPSHTIEQIRDRVLFAHHLAESRCIPPHIKHRIAIHEVGHLLVSLFCPLLPLPSKVSIRSESPSSLGYTIFSTGEDALSLVSKRFLQQRLSVLLGGRAAEELVFGKEEVSTGSISDLEIAFGLARQLVLSHGMGSRFFGSMESMDTKRRIDHEIHHMIQHSYTEAIAILHTHYDLLQTIAQLLLTQETISPEDWDPLVQPFLSSPPIHSSPFSTPPFLRR